MEKASGMEKVSFRNFSPGCLHCYESGANSVSCDTHMGSICGDLSSIPFFISISISISC